MKDDVMVRLDQLGACSLAVTWVGTQPDVRTAWESCTRGSWMVWLLNTLGVDLEPLVQRVWVSMDIPEDFTTHQLPPSSWGEYASIRGLQANAEAMGAFDLRRRVEGQPSIEQLRAKVLKEPSGLGRTYAQNHLQRVLEERTQVGNAAARLAWVKAEADLAGATRDLIPVLDFRGEGQPCN